MKSKKEIYKALRDFKEEEKFRSHESLGVGLLWIHEFLDYLFNSKSKNNEKE